MIDWSFCYVLFVSLRHGSSSLLRDYQIKYRGENKGINWLFYKMYISSAEASDKKCSNMFVVFKHSLDENPLALRQTDYSHAFSIKMNVLISECLRN